MGQRWTVRDGGQQAIESTQLLREVLLRQRGVADEQVEVFLEPRYEQVVHDPHLLHDMDIAVDRLGRAVRKGERVIVFGDYDLDGISGTALMVTVLEALGARVMPLLPHRVDHGYGLHLPLLRELADEFDLLVSVDCGIANVEEIGWLREQGKDVVVVDHHTLPDELPAANAIVHPAHPGAAYPFEHLSGAGTAWKVVSALLRARSSGNEASFESEKWLLDLACLGTLADVVPLLGENRAIVQYGLMVMARSRRPGIRALREVAAGGATLTEDVVGYRIAPLLNAPGRVDHPQPALDLLLADHEDDARRLIRDLERYNRQRRRISQHMQRDIEARLGDVDTPLVFAADSSWPAGVVGLVANRLSDRYERPAIVVGGAGDKLVGSGRAPAGFNLLPLLAASDRYLSAYGGHRQAAGFTVAKGQLDGLRSSLMDAASMPDEEKERAGSAAADAIVSQRVLNWDTADLLDQLAPYGEGNAKPLFVCRRLALADLRPVGKGGDHMKFTVRCEHDLLDGIGFGLTATVQSQKLVREDVVDALFHLEVNEYRGKRSLQLNVQDVGRSGEVDVADSGSGSRKSIESSP